MHDFVRMILNMLRSGIALATVAACLCGIVIAIAYVIFQKKNKGTQKFPWKKAVLTLLLIGYVTILLFATLLRQSGGYSNVNLHLFRAFREAWNTYSLKSWLNVLLNIALFVPLGFLLPIFKNFFRKWYVILLTGVGSAFFIEVLQYCFHRGIFDVDDLLSNTVGCMLGYCLVMAAVTLIDRKENTVKRCVSFLVFPVLFMVILTGIFTGYHLKEYGNLEIAPTFTVNTKHVTWELLCDLDDTVQKASVYYTEPLDKKSCGAFAAEFAASVGITFPDTYYYDNMTVFANHFTGDFLNVNYFDRSYEYKTVTGTLKDAEVDESTLRELLKPYDIDIPETAEFSYDGEGKHIFKVIMQSTGKDMVDGTLICWCKEGNVIEKIANSLISFGYYRDEPVITQSDAYKKLCKGEFSDGGYFEYFNPERVSVVSCVLDYRIDTKGFYRPVYVFTVENEGDYFGDFIVPAIK